MQQLQCMRHLLHTYLFKYYLHTPFIRKESVSCHLQAVELHNLFLFLHIYKCNELTQ